MLLDRFHLRLTWPLWLLILALIASGTALVENGAELPLDEHEAYVARTAEEMAQRGSWLVPYFNDQARLQKPPMAYWAVMAVNALSPNPGHVTEWEARLPSIIAGVVLVLTTAMLGRPLLGRRVGWLAGLLLAGSSGYVTYTHSARPEILYATFCTLGLLGFALSMRRSESTACDGSATSAKWFAWSGWLMMGLATLTKGPHLPAMLVVGWAIGMCAIGQRQLVLRTLRPASGVLIALAASLWWYGAVWNTVPDALQRWRIETIDRVVGDASNSSWRWADPYYVYRTIVLILPWAATYPIVVALPWIKHRTPRSTTRLLWWLVLAAMVGLSFASGRRWYYMLPAIPPIAILVVSVSMRIGRNLVVKGRGRTWRGIALLHFLAVATVTLAMSLASVGNADSQAIVATVAILASVVAGVATWKFLPDRRTAVERAIAAYGLASVIFFLAMAEAELLWRRHRFDHALFAEHVSARIPPQAPLVAWRQPWNVGVYYTHRAIPTLERATDLYAVIDGASPHAAWVVTWGDDQPPAPEGAGARMELEFAAPGERPVRLWRLQQIETGAE